MQLLKIPLRVIQYSRLLIKVLCLDSLLARSVSMNKHSSLKLLLLQMSQIFPSGSRSGMPTVLLLQPACRLGYKQIVMTCLSCRCAYIVPATHSWLDGTAPMLLFM